MDLLVMTLVGVVLLAVEQALPTLAATGPSLLVPLVLVLAWRRPSPAGALVAFALGYLSDLFAGALPGAGAFAHVALFVAARAVVAQVEPRGLWRPALLSAFGAVAVVGLAAAARWALAGGVPAGALGVLAPRAGLTALAAPFVAFLCVRVEDALGPAVARRERRGGLGLPLR